MRTLTGLCSTAAVVTALSCLSCSSTAPAPSSVTGRWTGSAVVGPEQWNFDLLLVQANDSVRGQATVRSVPARFTNEMDVRGTVSGDSVQLLLRPIEDANINIVANVTPAHLAGRMWLNAFTQDTHAIALDRQAAP